MCWPNDFLLMLLFFVFFFLFGKCKSYFVRLYFTMQFVTQKVTSFLNTMLDKIVFLSKEKKKKP